jgi:S1-C subfamily serine protease
VKSADDLRAAIGYARPGDTLQAKLQRGDQGMDLPVTFPAPPGPVFGVTYDADGGGKGAAVQEVAKGSVAEAAKVQAGDRILSFNGKDVPDGKSLAAALRTAKPGTTVKVRVLREGKEVDLEAAYPK